MGEKIGILLPDGSTLMVESKDDGGWYPGVWIYRVSQDTATETDIAVVEMTEDNPEEIDVFLYCDISSIEHTHKHSIKVSDIK